VLGIPLSRWQEREELEQLTYDDLNLIARAVAALQLSQIKPLIDAYGDALTCRFLLGDIDVLALGSGTTEADLEEFRRSTIATPSVILHIQAGPRRNLLEIGWDHNNSATCSSISSQTHWRVS